MSRRLWIAAIACLSLCLPSLATAQPDGESSWQQLQQMIDRAGPIDTYRAEFTQRKFTALLREPIESTGEVRIAGGVSRWDTRDPDASTMLIHDGTLQMYYPAQRTLEVYDLGDRLDQMAASPVPDVDTLRQNFVIESLEALGDEGGLAVTLLPRDPESEVAEAIDSVEVVIDPERACLTKLSVTDLDGETTELTFEHIELNPELDAASLELDVPEGTNVVHPLEGLDESR